MRVKPASKRALDTTDTCEPSRPVTAPELHHDVPGRAEHPGRRAAADPGGDHGGGAPDPAAKLRLHHGETQEPLQGPRDPAHQRKQVADPGEWALLGTPEIKFLHHG